MPTAEAVLARVPGENFPVALRCLPAGLRTDLLALYRFARSVDDLGDEPGYGEVGERLAALDALAEELARLPEPARLAPVAAVAPLVARGLPVALLADLVQANRHDQVHADYATWAELTDYCALSAVPVGRAVLHILGAADARREQASDAVCTALQVLEHLQDVAQDAARGRVYLPREDRERFGVGIADLRPGPTPPQVRRLVAELCGRAERLLAAGPWLAASLRGPGRLAVAGFVAGGRAVVDALARADYDVLDRQVRPARTDLARHALALACRRRP